VRSEVSGQWSVVSGQWKNKTAPLREPFWGGKEKKAPDPDQSGREGRRAVSGEELSIELRKIKVSS